MKFSRIVGLTFALMIPLSLFQGCSSIPEVKKQNYAALKTQRTFEYDFPTVWRGIEEAVRKYKVTERDPEDVNPIELKKLTRRKLDTDWIYSQSRDKYQEYQVNGFPKKVYLQTKLKYTITAQTLMGGVNVSVDLKEEVERLKEDGTSAGYTSMEADSARANEMLDRIQYSILSGKPPG